MAGRPVVMGSQPAFEMLEQRLLLAGSDLSAVLAAVPAGPNADATARFRWSGYEAAESFGGLAAEGGRTAVLEYHFAGPVELTPTPGGHIAALAGEERWAGSGDPIVPVRTSCILLPPGTRIVSAEAQLAPGVVVAEGVELLAGAEPVPLTGAFDAEIDYQPHAASASFPSAGAVTFSTQLLAGFSVGYLRIFPVQYDAADGTVTYHPTVRVTVTTAPLAPGAALGVRGEASDLERVLDLVENDTAVHDYEVAPAASTPPAAGALPAGGPFEYVLVTSESLAPTFQELIDHKLARGVSATLVTAEYIYENFTPPYAGEDDPPGRIREFLAQAYTEWNTRWVLLGGDTAVVPERQVYVTSGSYTADIATDMYFACLDGPYNDTADTQWGTSSDGAGGGEVDLAAELAVARAPVETPEEAANLIRKIILYETTPAPNATSGLLLGERLKTDPLTWGGDSLDYIQDEVIPESCEITKLYERDGAYSRLDVIDALNDSPGFVSHLGHSTTTGSAKLSRGDVDALTNEHPYLIYSQGCLAGQFTIDDAIGEHHLKASNAAWAGVFNSHYGWYSPGDPQGSGTMWALAFWDALFVERVLRIGEAHVDAKMDMLSHVSDSGSGRWLFFASTLFGDPESRFYMPHDGGPSVVGQTAAGAGAGEIASVRLEFDEPMDRTSFSPSADVASFSGPGGIDLAGRITGYLWLDPYTLEVLFQPQHAAGSYRMVLGPGLLDAGGEPIDQDGDGQGGEAWDDACRVAFAIAGAGEPGMAYEADMGSDPGWTFDPGTGEYRWEWGQPTGGFGDPDGGHTGESVVGYNLDGPYANGMIAPEYATTPVIDCSGFGDVTLHYWRWLRAYPSPDDQAAIQITTDGVHWTTVWQNDEFLFEHEWSEQVLDISAVADGQPHVQLRWQMGPTDAALPYAGWNLDDVILTGVEAYLTVFEHKPSGQAAGPVSHVDVTFAAPIDPATLGADDFALTGPGGPVEVTSVSHVEGSTYRVQFGARSAVGRYDLVVGPNVANRGGEWMDQDGDGSPGEPEDAYVGAFEIAPPDAVAPSVAAHAPSGQVVTPPRAVRFAFNEEMDPFSFSLADVVSFAGPGGEDLRNRITGYHWHDARTLEVCFQPPAVPGPYAMTLGPHVADDPPGGSPLDQDGDGTPGEPEDTYTAAFEYTIVDLLGVSLTLSQPNLELAAGTTSASFTIRNAGESDAPAFTVRFYLSDDEVIDPGEDLLLGLAGGQDGYRAAGLPAHAELADTVELIAPAGDPFGTDNAYHIGMVLDADGEVAEVNEANNAGRGAGVDLAAVLYGRLFGTVWHDLNANGAQEAGEPGLGDWTVYVDTDGSSEPTLGEPAVTTRPDGTYVLSGLGDGGYTVRLLIPPAWALSIPAGGAHGVTLAAGETVDRLDFGAARHGSIAGGAFHDADFDGQWSAGEGPLVGWTVYLDTNDSGGRDDGEPTAASDEQGYFAFADLPPGRYVVRQVAEDGWLPTAPPGGAHVVLLTSGAAVGDRDFGSVDAATFRRPDDVSALEHGLNYACYYHDRPAGVDDLAGLVPEYVGVTDSFDLSVRDRDQDYGLIFTGYLQVAETGPYAFHVLSDDGARLYLGETLIVDNDGYHPPIEATGHVGLMPGFHEITVRYLQAAGDQRLTVGYTSPGGDTRPIPAVALFRAPLADREPPRIRYAWAIDATSVQVAFSEAVGASALDPANYRLDAGPAVQAAALSEDARSVTLVLSAPLEAGLTYTVTVNGVADLAGNVIAPDSRAAFAFEQIDADLLVWWPFDDLAGSVASDASGNGRDGDVAGAQWAPEGRVGGALRFDGVDDVVADEDAAAYLEHLEAVTVALWIRADDKGTDRGFLTTREPGDNSCLNIRYDEQGYFGQGENVIKFYLQTTEGKSQYEGAAGTQTTDWQHVAVTWHTGDRPELYVDGHRQIPTFEDGPPGGTLTGTEKLLVGTGYKLVDGAWEGLIDDVRIYGRRLDAQEVAALANLEPVAADDRAYELDQDGTLVVEAADGVLANDSDGDTGPDALTACLLGEPSHGQLALAADGSFVYVPEPYYAGPDRFTYRAYDGLEYSNVATVTLNVHNTAPAVQAWYSAAEHGNGAGEVRLTIPDDGAFTEPRCSGVARLLIEFSEPIDPASFGAGAVTIVGRDIAGAIDLTGLAPAVSTRDGGRIGVIEFSEPLPDVARYLVRIDGVTDPGGLALAGDRDRVLTALAGDVSGDGRVNATDLSRVRGDRANPIEPPAVGQVRADVSGDGRVNATDLSRVRARHGHDTREISTPALSAGAPALPLRLDRALAAGTAPGEPTALPVSARPRRPVAIRSIDRARLAAFPPRGRPLPPVRKAQPHRIDLGIGPAADEAEPSRSRRPAFDADLLDGLALPGRLRLPF